MKWMRTRSQSASARGFSPKRKRYVFLLCGCVSVIQTSNPRESRFSSHVSSVQCDSTAPTIVVKGQQPDRCYK